MKYPIIIFLLLLSLNSFAQPEYDERINFLKVQGGFVFDSGGSKNYAGFNYLNIGFSKYKSLRVDGVELEIVGFDQIVERPSTGTPSFLADWNCERLSVELSAFRTYPLINGIRNGIFVGPYISAGYIATQLSPVELTSGFPIDSKCYCLGLGGKIDYYAQLTEKVFLTFGVKVNLISAGVYDDRINNPALTETQQQLTSFEAGLLLGKIPFSLGVSFSL